MTASTELLWSKLSKSNTLNPAQRHRWRLILEEVAASGNLGAAKVVVDLGCGSGTLLRRVRESSAEPQLIGLDIEELALERARKAVPDAEFRRVDLNAGANSAGTLAGQADVVLCSEVIEHLAEPQHAVSLANALLRPGGVFVVTVPSGAMTPFDKAIGHLRHYDLDSLGTLITAGGFTMHRLYRWGFPFHTMFRILVGLFKTVPAQWTDEGFSRTTGFVFSILNRVFYLNRKSRRFGRQLVAVGIKAAA